MASRRHIPASYVSPIQAPAIMHIGSLPADLSPVGSLPPEFLDKKLAAQAAEIEQLAGDNHQLAATHVSLRQGLAAAQREGDEIREHIRSIQTESDIQIRLLLDKIAKKEVDLRACESVKKELQEAHTVARSLLTGNQELSGKIHNAMQELEKARADVKKLPEMHAELDSLRKEHQNLRKIFEHEKGLNVEKVEQMKLMEKDLIGMSKEAERLHAEVLNAEKRAQGFDPYGRPCMNPDPVYPSLPMHVPPYVDSYGRPYMNPDPMYPSLPMHVTPYVDSYGRPHVPMAAGPMGAGIIPYGVAPGGVGTEPLPITGGNAAWESHDASSQAS